MMIDATILSAAEHLLAACRLAGLRIVTAESCTGGLIAATLTAVAGSSDVVDRSFVTYSNAAKTEMLGVPPALIGRLGAVSSEVANAMALGALARSAADVAVSVTGIAGPDGGSAEKPVGLVWFGIAMRGVRASCVMEVFPGDRSAVRRQTVSRALALLAAKALPASR